MCDLMFDVSNFSGGCFYNFYDRWEQLTSDRKIVETVQGLHINLTDSLPISSGFQYPFGESEELFVSEEIGFSRKIL